MQHFHPCNFRCRRFYDRGWGEAAFEYRWDSTSGVKAEDGVGNPDLHHCFLYELTTYEETEGVSYEGFLHPPIPRLQTGNFAIRQMDARVLWGMSAFLPHRVGRGIGTS